MWLHIINTPMSLYLSIIRSSRIYDNFFSCDKVIACHMDMWVLFSCGPHTRWKDLRWVGIWKGISLVEMLIWIIKMVTCFQTVRCEKIYNCHFFAFWSCKVFRKCGESTSRHMAMWGHIFWRIPSDSKVEYVSFISCWFARKDYVFNEVGTECSVDLEILKESTIILRSFMIIELVEIYDSHFPSLWN